MCAGGRIPVTARLVTARAASVQPLKSSSLLSSPVVVGIVSPLLFDCGLTLPHGRSPVCRRRDIVDASSGRSSAACGITERVPRTVLPRGARAWPVAPIAS
jgi:hypothetical protein